MSGIRNLLNKYINILKQIPEDRKTNALIMGNDALALTVDRLINQGVGANGEKFKTYSKREFKYFLVKPSDFNASSKVSKFKKDARAKKIVGSYENMRKYAGLPIDKRTHSFNGDMLKSIFASIESHNIFRTVVILKAKDKENQNKVNWNSNKVGQNILSWSKAEKELVKELNEDRKRNLRKNN